MFNRIYVFRRLFPNSQVVWVEGKNAGHWLHEDRHEDFMKVEIINANVGFAYKNSCQICFFKRFWCLSWSPPIENPRDRTNSNPNALVNFEFNISFFFRACLARV